MFFNIKNVKRQNVKHGETYLFLLPRIFPPMLSKEFPLNVIQYHGTTIKASWRDNGQLFKKSPAHTGNSTSCRVYEPNSSLFLQFGQGTLAITTNKSISEEFPIKRLISRYRTTSVSITKLHVS